MTRVTRTELYDLVWKIPIRRLAAQFGISDVALAKTCARMNVPKPGRGYWARLAAGAKLKKPPLSKDPKAEQEWVFSERDDRKPPPPPRPESPKVRVPRDLRAVHDAVRRLGEALGDAQPDAYERLLVGPGRSPTLAVTIGTHRRALLLLTALATALAARGHVVATTGDDHTSMSLVVTIGEESIPLWMLERLDQQPHVRTPAENDRAAKGYTWRIPKYDKIASGKLQLFVDGHRGGHRAWSDTKTRKLEDQLGRVILAVEHRAEVKRNAKVAERERLEQEAAQRRRDDELRLQQQREVARAQYRQELVKDLRMMAARWSEADAVRRFITEAEAVLGEQRSPDADAWLAWARTCVDDLDPLTHPESVPKRVEPHAETRAR